MYQFDPSQFNPQQRQAVLHDKGPMLVLAGAGSGKTRIITHRVAHLITYRQVPPSSIVAVSFTNKAAHELKQRVAALIGQQSAAACHLSTFHTMGANILRTHIGKLGWKTPFAIIDNDDQRAILRNVLKELHLEGSSYDPDKLLNFISKVKSSARPPLDLPGMRWNPQARTLAKIFDLYQSARKSVNAVDFDDMIALPTAMFEAYPDLLERYASAWQYLLVDEYQDTNALQFRLLQLLSSRHANLMVVGDDDQSIYAFRGADSRHILDFPSHFDNVQVVALEQNYRSTQNILDAANAVIAQNATRHAKQLWTSARSDDKIQSCTCPTPEAEATFVIDQILAQRSALNLTYKDFAILYRTNPQNRLLEEACLSKGLPYRIVGGSKFFDQAEVRDLIFYLRAAFSHHDELALRRIVNTPRRGVATATMHHIDEVAKKHQVAFFEALKIVAASDHLRGTTQHKVETFVSTLERFHRRFMAKAEPLAETMQALIDAIHYLPYIQSSSTSDAQAIHRQENVQEFVRTLSAFEQREGRDLFAFIQRLCLEPPQKEENDDDQVTLMTLHASKGLEFPSVTIIGCEENFLPHANALDEPDLSEERRLFYVGITRAKRYLCLTRCEKRQRFHEAIDMQPSRFLADIPETCIETLKPDTQSIQDQQAELKRMAQARFAQLRDLL